MPTAGDEAEAHRAASAGIAVLQRLFPGRVVRIDADDDPTARSGPATDTGDDGESDATER